MGGGWKDRYFVLLSTRELLCYENETSQKRKGSLDLKTATAVEVLPPPPALPHAPPLALSLTFAPTFALTLALNSPPPPV